LIIIGSLLLLVLFSGLSLPNRPVQADASPTPTTLVTEGGQTLKSGDTEGLILGAGIILFIILGGVIMQRMVLKDENQ